jgi:hypothetical protein
MGTAGKLACLVHPCSSCQVKVMPAVISCADYMGSAFAAGVPGIRTAQLLTHLVQKRSKNKMITHNAGCYAACTGHMHLIMQISRVKA